MIFPRSSQGSILALVLTYAAFAATWILFSDMVVESLFSDPAQITLVSTAKGWLFVIITSLLLYGLMQRRPNGKNPPATPSTSLRPLAIPIVLLTLAIAILTIGGITHTVALHKGREAARLQTIADLKVRQIADWLNEKRGDARFVQTSPLFAENYLHWRKNGDITSRDRLIARLEDYQKYHSTINAILLLDDQGDRLWGSSKAPDTISPILRDAAREAALNRQVKLLGPYLGMVGHARLNFIAPLSKAGDHPPVIVIDADLEGYLFPMMNSWPTASGSGETLIFRQDGDQVLYLNELRFRSGTAAQLQIPIASPKMLSSQLLRDMTLLDHLIEGVDYRGEPAMGVARPVPGTDWFLIAKLDKAELYREAAQEVIWITLAGLLAFLIVLAGVFLLRQRQQLAIDQSMRQTQEEKLRALQLLDGIADGSTDAIFAQDTEGRFILFNPAAEQLTGKMEKDVLGRDEATLFPAGLAEKLKADNRRVIAENRTLTFEDHLAIPDGEHIFLTTKGPLRDTEGRAFGMFGIARDITDIKNTELALRLERDRKQRYLDTVQSLMLALDNEGHITMINRAGCALLGYTENELLGLNWFESCLPQPAGMEQIFPVFRRIMAGELTGVEYFENTVRCRDGHERLIAWHNATLTDDAGCVIGTLSSGEDITERERAAAALRASEERYRVVIENAADAILVANREGRYTYANQSTSQMLGYSIDELLAMSIPDVVPEAEVETAMGLFAQLQAGGHIRTEVNLKRKDGSTIPVELNAVRLPDGSFYGACRDITERKQADQAIQRQAEELIGRNEELERFNRAVVGRELDMIELKRHINALSGELGREPPYPLAFLNATDSHAKESE